MRLPWDANVSKGIAMVQKAYYLALFVVASVFVAGVVAGGNLSEKRQDKREIRQNKTELGATSTALARLSGTVDSWVKANLRGDDEKAQYYEESISRQVQADIASSRQLVNRYEAEVRRSNKEYHRPYRFRVARHDDRVDFHDDVKDLDHAKQLLAVKERLVSAFNRTAVFSNRYRLVGDYMETMRRELNLTRAELAEDMNELHEDRVEGHRK